MEITDLKSLYVYKYVYHICTAHLHNFKTCLHAALVNYLYYVRAIKRLRKRRLTICLQQVVLLYKSMSIKIITGFLSRKVLEI